MAKRRSEFYQETRAVAVLITYFLISVKTEEILYCTVPRLLSKLVAVFTNYLLFSIFYANSCNKLDVSVATP